jgi:hypothetical protein
MGVGTIQHIATGAKLDLQTFAQTAEGAASTALGLPPAASNALVAGIAITGGIAKGNPLDKTLSDAAVTALPISDDAKRSMTEASTLTLELAHSGTISVTQSARIAACTAGLPPTNPLRDNIETSLTLIQRNPKNAVNIMIPALHSGLADTLISMGADQCPQNVKNAIKSGTALGSAVIYQEHRAAGLVRVKGKLIESGIQQAKHHPLFQEARKLAATKNATHGFDHANGLLQHQVGLFDVTTARNSHDPIQRHGFDIASSARIGAVAHPQPPLISSASHAGYAIAHGMRSHNPERKVALMQTIQQNPSASVGATLAVKEAAVDNDSLWTRILRFFGIQSTSANT